MPTETEAPYRSKRKKSETECTRCGAHYDPKEHTTKIKSLPICSLCLDELARFLAGYDTKPTTRKDPTYLKRIHDWLTGTWPDPPTP